MSGEWPYLAPPRSGVAARPGSARPLSVGVLVTAHDVAPFLPGALDSVLAQTLPPDEVVVCDDASTDDVEGAVAPYLGHVHLIRRSTNGGEGAAKNTAIAALSTDLVVVLDGDDAMRPQRLEALHWVATQRADLDIITTEWEDFGAETGESWSLAAHFPVHAQEDEILRWNFLPAPALRRAPLVAAGGFDETLTYGPDWELYARMLLRGSRAALVPEPLYRYRRWPGQQTADQQRVLRGRVDVLSRIAADPLLNGRQREMLARTRTEHQEAVWLDAVARGDSSRQDAARVARRPTSTSRRRVLAGLGVLSPGLAGVLIRRVRSQ